MVSLTAGGAPHWHVVFTVADRDDAVGVAQRLGAEVVSSEETTWTWEAAIRDPQGAELTLSQFAPPDDWG
jgi:predicted enzyme related to lactoylglutathione lyase